MDSAAIIISLIVFVLVAVPVAFIVRQEKKRKQNILLLLTRLAEKNNVLITQKEFWGKYAIGIDENSKKLIYMNYHPGKEIEYCFDLKAVKHCKIENVSKTIGTGNIRQSTIFKLNLLLTYSDSKSPYSTLEFYDADNGGTVADYQQAEKWVSVINKVIGIK
jgi:hypothetical protein